MAGSHTVTSSESWLGRLFSSIKSVLVGVVMFLAAFPLLFWNEGRAVQTARSLEEGAGVVVSVPAASVDPSKDGRLVHLTGEATTAETLADPEFGVKANAIKLVRTVEMYQWEEEEKSETRKKLGGGTETVKTYTYKQTWSDEPVDSSDFQKPEGHTNPTSLPVPSTTLVAQKVTIGAFDLPPSMVERLDQSEELRLDENAGVLPASMKGRVVRAGAGYYMGTNPAAPAVGDARITFQAVRPATVSLVALQVGSSFDAYQAAAGDPILMLKYGTLRADAMFLAAQKENTAFTWLFRFIGFFVMFIGLTLVFRPIAVFADVIPILGTILGAGLGLFAGLSAAVLSLFTIAFAWIFYRPLVAVPLLLLAVGGIVLLVRTGLRKRAARAAAPAAKGVA